MLGFPPGSQVGVGRWIGYAKTALGVNMGVNVCVHGALHPFKGVF